MHREKFQKKLIQVAHFYLQFKGDILSNFYDSQKTNLFKAIDFANIENIKIGFEQALRLSFQNFYI